ncbi:DUF4064 domain-containing protein [Lapidilactobacillus mulanensis]|uniref:DUF4064 domain-containing protein n=1 Tax=Lapidilactobacillus mulanensis TaxID=2485999 RepID=A0ABW4DPI4_9LACO|nr:DUF4064 domain-containing protein [Lapidilactobacillus mulanensis]
MNRRLEMIIGYIGAAIVLIFLGGFTVSMNSLTVKQYQRIVYPIFKNYLAGTTPKSGLQLFQTLGTWFGVTVVIVLALVAFTNLLLRSNKNKYLTGGLYFLIGVITLLGSQLLAYPIAFIFFVNAALCIFRKGAQLDATSENS